MRLDKFLCDLQYGTRSSIKKDIRNGFVSVNGMIIRQSDYQVKEGIDEVSYRGISKIRLLYAA